MLTRLAVPIAFVGASLWGSSLTHAAAAEPARASYFADAPEDALIRKLEPGAGCSLVLPDTPASALAKRLRVRATHTTEIAAVDPLTGLAMRQRQRWLPEFGIVLIDSTLVNQSKTARSVKSIRVGDWTFRAADTQDSLRYRTLTYRNAQWYGSTFWTGPDWTRVGKDWHHPGHNTPSVRRFVAPHDGRVAVSGRVYKADTKNGGGDGVRLFVCHRDRVVWNAEINGDDAKGVEPNLTFDVREGDRIRFIVHKRGHIYCDTTRWDPVITYADGRQFRASKGFAAKRQGAGGWFYEMEMDPGGKTGLPRLYAFGRGFALREESLSLGRQVRLSHEDALPVFVLADGGDRSGVALALAAKEPWRLQAALASDGRLAVRLIHREQDADWAIAPGQSVKLPRVVFGAYSGPWAAGMALIQRLLASGRSDLRLEGITEEIAATFRRATATRPTGSPALDLWAMVQADWHRQDKIEDQAASYTAAAARHMEQSRQLIERLRSEHGRALLADEAARLEQFEALMRQSERDLAGWRGLYFRVRWLKREIALANPLMRFGPMLFVKRVPTSYSHLVMQYFGWRARPGGGLFVLDRPGRSLAARDILDGRLAGGCVLEPCLSYDAKRVVFSFVKCPEKALQPGPILNDVDVGFYHIYEVNVDGTGLRQLTSGPYDDLMPAYLPDRGIVFCSTRRRGYARCFGGQFSRRWHVYTLHRMDADGKNLRTLSRHDTNEWFPAVANTGHVLYARWDYIDRDAVTHQNLWASHPDGTNPVALWGNATLSPHCTFQIQPIPGSSKIVFTASAHHSVTGGSIAMVDPRVANNGQDAITRITPEIRFPEAEGRISEYYAAPWPLSEDDFLVAYSPTPLVFEPRPNLRNALGIYLLDRFGNRELLYRDPDIGSTNPRPLAPRPRPPVVASGLPAHAPATGEMVLLDVHEGLGRVARGRIKAIRLIQILPKTTHRANSPPIGVAREENTRAVLGTVPVERDGSAYFVAPAGKPILFQALDEDGFAYQTMRSLTYVQPGERVSCVGCHESRMTAPVNRSVVATRRPPSKIDPGPFGGRPFSFIRVVQPVLDRHCVKCHGGPKPKKGMDLSRAGHRGFTRSYWSLCPDPKKFWGAGTNPKNATEALVPCFGARNRLETTPPGGTYCALGSRLIKMLRAGHNDVKLTADEFQRLAMWIDCNAVFYGAYSAEDQAKQLRGEPLPMPEIQ